MIERIVQALSLAFLILPPLCPRARKAADPAAATVQNFYDALVASMKAGGTTKSRYDKLKPAVEQAFDIPGMTALSVGPTWSSIAPADQKALTEAFERMTVANYARNFDSYQRREIHRRSGGDRARFATSSSKARSSPPAAMPFPSIIACIRLDGSWKIVDIYLNGNISQLAQKRSDFGATLQASGPQGLAKKINALADQTLG